MRIMIAYICLFFLFSCNGQQSEQKMNLQIYNNPLERNNKYKQDKTTTVNNNEHMRVNSIIKPSYNVYVRSKNTQFLLLVDDVPAFKFFGKESGSGMGINGNIPINQCLLKSGKHHVKGILFPKYGATKLNEDTFLTLTNSVKESGTSEEIQFLEIKSPDGYYKKSSTDDQENNGNGKWILPLDGLPYYEIIGEFDAKLPFEIEGWTNSVNLKEEMKQDNNFKNEIQKTYDVIKSIIEKKDINSFTQLIKEREDLLATAFNFSTAQKNSELQEFLDMIQSEDYELAPYPKNADIHFYGYGKLVTLLTPEREGVIKLINKKDPNEEVILDFYFHRKKKGYKLEVIL